MADNFIVNALKGINPAEVMPFGAAATPEGSQTALSAMLGGLFGMPKHLIESAKTATPGLRRQDVTDLPGKAQPNDPLYNASAETALALAGAGAPAAEAGAAGIFGGKLAKTADMKALQEAEQMRMAGKHPKDMWEDTGWFMSPMDSKWRFEIPDNKMALSRMSNVEGESLRGRVQSLSSHPDLLKAYPEIGTQGLWVTRDLRHPKGTGSYNPIHDDLKGFLKPYSEISAPNMQVGRSVGAHEMQHAVQDIENFTFGAHPDTYARFIEQEGRKAGHAFDYRDIEQKAHDFYKRTAGEVEARNVQKRLDYGPLDRKMIAPWESQDTPYTSQLMIEALKGK